MTKPFDHTAEEIESKLWEIYEKSATKSGATLFKDLRPHAQNQYGGNINKTIFSDIDAIDTLNDDQKADRRRLLLATAEKCADEAGKQSRELAKSGTIDSKTFDQACEYVREKYLGASDDDKGAGPICP